MNIPKISALYESSLASALSAAGSSFTVVNGNDRDGNALSGLYGFIIDEGSADEEFITGTISGSTVTITYRGTDADSPITEIAANKKAHRRGASVKITDYPIMGFIREMLNGTSGYELPNHLKYASNASFTDNEELVSKRYADALANTGAADGTTTVQGLVELATQAEMDAGTTSGGTTATLVPTPALIRAKKYHDYVADAVGTDSYAITVTPAITAYSAGQVFTFKAGTANTDAASLNVCALGAKTIKKDVSSDLITGDILLNQIVTVVYDGTNFQLVSNNPQIYKNKFFSTISSRSTSAASSSVTIAHGLGVIPSIVRLSASYYQGGGGIHHFSSIGSFDGTHHACVYDQWRGSVTTGDQLSGNSTTNTIMLGDDGGNSTAADPATLGQTGVVTVDATNITITWTKHGAPSGITVPVLVEAQY